MDKNKCSSCGETKCSCKNKDFTKAVIEIDNPEQITLMRKVVIPASMGDDTVVPPAVGKYHNVLLNYEANNKSYLYSSDGIPTLLTGTCTCHKNLVVYLPNGMTTYTNNDAPIPIPEVIEALKRGQSVFLVDARYPERIYVVTAASAEDGIWSMRADQTGINANDNDGYWHINGRDNLWRRVEFVPDTPGGEEVTHLVLSNPTTATWSETGSIAIPLSDGSAVVMGTSVSTDVVFTKDDGTTMTVGDLYTALTNGESFEIDLPFGEINSACARDSAAIVATVENVKLDGSSKQTLDQTSQGYLSEIYTSSVPVVAHLPTPWGGMLLDERFGVEHLTIDDNGTMTSSYRFVVNTYENFQPPR